MPVRPSVIALVLVILTSFVLAACGDEGDGGGASGETASLEGPRACEPRSGGTVVMGLAEDLPTFNPGDNPVFGPTAYNSYPLVFERLVTVSEDLEEVEPQLATDWTHNEDFTEWEFTIREGVKFSDGSALDADDVAFSLDYNFGTFNGYALGPLEKIEAVDPRTVQMTFESPFAPLLTQGLGNALSGFIYPENFGGKSDEEFFEVPTGSGPYTVTSYRPDAGVVFERNDGYWGDPAYLETIELRVTSDANKRLLGLESGDLDFIDKVPADQVENLPDGVVARVLEPTAETEDLFLSSTVPMFKDENVRRAISLAINREEIVEGGYSGYADVGTTLVPEALPNVEPPDAGSYEFDLEQAKELMAQSDFPEGGSVELLYVRGDANTQLEVELIQQDLAELGIDLELRPLSASEYLDLAEVGKRPSVLFQNIAITPDPLDFLAFYASSDGYYGGWDVTPVEKIIERYQATDDPAVKQDLLRDYENYTYELSAQIPVLSALVLNAHIDALSGLNITPLNEADLAGAWLCEG